MNVKSTPLQRQQWLDYILLLTKWNQAFNLTAVRSKEEMITRHILDSLSIAPFVSGERILDVGTGAGLPGIPLAIYAPEKQVFMLDSSQKKQVFVTQAIHQIGLNNAFAVHSLVEKYQPEQKFSTIVTRAFASLDKILPLVSPLMVKGGKLLAMLGKVETELSIDKGYRIIDIIALQIPGSDAKRHVAILSQVIDS